MRDLSSAVCSSDLRRHRDRSPAGSGMNQLGEQLDAGLDALQWNGGDAEPKVVERRCRAGDAAVARFQQDAAFQRLGRQGMPVQPYGAAYPEAGSSEERRVGKEGVRT